MNYKIGILASDIEMKGALEALYPQEIKSGQFLIDVLDNCRIEEQGQAFVEAGAQLIIGRSGGYSRNAGQVSVPVLRLKVTTGDILNALRKAMVHNKRIDLFLWDEINFYTELLELVDREVTVHRFPNGSDIEALFHSVFDEHTDGIVVGGGVVCSLARRLGLPYVFISPSNDNIQSVVDNAYEVLNNIEEIKYKNELLTTVVHGSHDAIIAIDANYEVLMFNEKARDILKISPEYVIGKKLNEILPELAFLTMYFENRVEQNEELMNFRDLVLTYNTSMIDVDGEIKGMLFSFQNITKLQTLEQKIRLEMNKKGLFAKYNFSDIVFEDAIMEGVMVKAKKVGKSDSNAIIYGESGTGKEIMASSLHNISKRSSAPFVAINCAAITEALLESELFGYEEGSFTGARKGGKPGLFELAHGGTIFLDEINSISSTLQAKLLRVVEEKEVMRIGSDYVIPLDVRIISAANEDLKEMVSEDRFRNDLFFRLSTLEIHLPPLRERKSDIYPLFLHFLKDALPDKDIRWPNEQEIQMLNGYSWPGNIRELKNVCERYVLFDELALDASEIEVEVVPESLAHHKIDLKEIHQLVEGRIINQLLSSGMNKTQVAEVLGISRTALWKKINR